MLKERIVSSSSHNCQPMKGLSEFGFFYNPVWIILKNIDMYTVVIKDHSGGSVGKEHLEPCLERGHPRLVERIIEIKQGAVLGQVVEGVSANDFYILIPLQPAPCFLGNCFVQLDSYHLVAQSTI